jgi:eukaryotic-like serine/threonine-protein kinase
VGAIENAIVKVEPRPIRDLKSGFPAGLEQIVAKTLEKDPDQRYQSAAELREDLCTLQAQLAPPSSSALRADPGPNWADRQKRYLIAALITAVAVLGALTVLLRKSPGPQPFADFTITQITNTGKADRAAISPDAKYVAHVNDDNGLKSIRLQNISTGSDAEILPPSVMRFRSLVFSPDGNYLYFRKVVNGIGSEWDAFRIPVLGGKPERIARDVDSDIIFSPDGRRISYVRANDPVEGEYRILEANLDGGGETVISIQEIKGFGHEGYPPFAAWSPDGARIVYTFAKMAYEPGIVRVLDIQNKHLDTLQHFSDLLTFAVRWLPNPNWLMLVHSPKTGDAAPSQISAFSLLDRRLYPITRDTNSYSSLTLSSDGKTAAAVQTRTISLVDYMPVTSRNHETRRSSLENVNSRLGRRRQPDFLGWVEALANEHSYRQNVAADLGYVGRYRWTLPVFHRFHSRQLGIPRWRPRKCDLETECRWLEFS